MVRNWRVRLDSALMSLSVFSLVSCGVENPSLKSQSITIDFSAEGHVNPLLGFLDKPEWPAPRSVDPNQPFDELMCEMMGMRPAVMREAMRLLEYRYDLSDKTLRGMTMTRGKPMQVGIRVKLPLGLTWEELGSMSANEIKEKDLFPEGFLPLPHPNHPEGGMLFHETHINEVRRQTGRDLKRFDLDLDIPERFLPEFPPAIFLTTRPDLGDVSRGQLVTSNNFFELFKDILNPKQLDGLRLLVTPLAQQQFNLTDDRRSTTPQLGVACMDCHVNGHTNGATHLVGDIRPQEHRNRIDTPSLRGVNIQRLFGSQRALKSVEDFTEFEQRAAYFDGDITKAAKKGVITLNRATDVHHMSEFQELMDFPPAPKLDLFGRLDPSQASESELRGESVFFGKGKCSSCHVPPYFTDLSMHNLRTERFFKPRTVRGMVANGDGPIKTFPLRGLKDSPPYLHDGRLLTIEDTVEFFNLILETRLTTQEKQDLVNYLRTL